MKTEINFLEVEDDGYAEIIDKIIDVCFLEENYLDENLYVNVVLTNPENIKKLNKKYRDIDKETDVLSFPMFEKEELKSLKLQYPDVLGDIVISVEKVKKQAKEYGHSFERELSYMLVHGFYHIIGYDHIKENDKKQMREKEENILNKLNITR